MESERRGEEEIESITGEHADLKNKNLGREGGKRGGRENRRDYRREAARRRRTPGGGCRRRRRGWVRPPRRRLAPPPPPLASRCGRLSRLSPRPSRLARETDLFRRVEDTAQFRADGRGGTAVLAHYHSGPGLTERTFWIGPNFVPGPNIPRGTPSFRAVPASTERALKDLDLECARLNEDSNHVVDFSGCPALLKLKMKYCRVNADQMRSPSLEHLTMVGCYFREMECTLIRLPSLITLEFTDCFGRKPLLEDFPSLAKAFVRLDHCCYDNFWRKRGDDKHPECKCSFDVFFHALSNVRCMELSAPPDLFDFNRDIMPCPEFSKLKTLLLIDWFVADGLSALPWFLQHSPILERLTLEFSSEAQKSSEGIKRSCKVLEQSIASKHLKTVEIRCKEEGHGMSLVLPILKILKAFGVPLEKIDIHCSEKGYGCKVLVLRVLASAPYRGQRNQDV
ncbi:hypothetical protein EJB05_05821, partial [Eragrostis curvula]